MKKKLQSIKLLKLFSVFSILTLIFLFTQNCSQRRFKNMSIFQAPSNPDHISDVNQKNLSVTYPGNSYQFVKGVTIENTKPYILKSKNESSVTFTVLETLPKGIVLNPITGELSGTPETAVTSRNFTIQARDGEFVSNIIFNLAVVDSISLPALTYQIASIDLFVSLDTTFQYKPQIIKPEGYSVPVFYLGNHEVLPKGFSFDSLTGIIKIEPPYELFSSKLFNFCLADKISELELIESAIIGDNCTPILIKFSSEKDLFDPGDELPSPGPGKETPTVSISHLFSMDLTSNSSCTSIKLRSPLDLSFANKNIISIMSSTFSGKTVCDIPNEAIVALENLVKTNGICLRETSTCAEKFKFNITGSADPQADIGLCSYTYSRPEGKYGYYEICNGKQSILKDLFTNIESSKLSNCVDVSHLVINLSDSFNNIKESTSITINCNEANQKLKLNYSSTGSSCEQFVACDSNSNYTTTFSSFSCFNPSSIIADGQTNLTATVVDNNNLEIPYYGISTTLRIIPKVIAADAPAPVAPSAK